MGRDLYGGRKSLGRVDGVDQDVHACGLSASIGM